MTENIFDFPRVSVIIPVFNAELFIGKCIEHLLHQNYPSDKTEIIIMDDGSEDKTLDIIKSYGLQYFSSQNRGPARARNEGAKRATGSILLFIDADCLADESLIIRHVLAHMFYAASDPGVQVIGGGIEGYNQNFWSVCDDFCSWYNNHPMLPRKQVDCHPSANMSMPGRFMDMVKFDEELRAAEDYAFCVEATRKGYKIAFEPEAKVHHINRTSYKSFIRHAKHWAGSQYQLLEKGILGPPHKDHQLPKNGIIKLNREVKRLPENGIIKLTQKVQQLSEIIIIKLAPRVHHPLPLFIIYAIIQSICTTLQAIYCSFKARRFGVLIYVPFIFLNKLYLNYFTGKLHWDFFRDLFSRIGDKSDNNHSSRNKPDIRI